MADQMKSAGDPAPKNCGLGAARISGESDVQGVANALDLNTLLAMQASAVKVVLQALEDAQVLAEQLAEACERGDSVPGASIARALDAMLVSPIGYARDLEVYQPVLARKIGGDQ